MNDHVIEHISKNEKPLMDRLEPAASERPKPTQKTRNTSGNTSDDFDLENDEHGFHGEILRPSERETPPSV